MNRQSVELLLGLCLFQALLFLFGLAFWEYKERIHLYHPLYQDKSCEPLK